MRTTDAAFPSGIGHVVGARAEKEMVGPHAGRIIAVMTDVHPGGDCRAMCDGPDYPSRARRTTKDGHPPIPILVAATYPQPTTAGLVNKLPQTVQRFSLAVLGDVFQRLSLDPAEAGGCPDRKWGGVSATASTERHLGDFIKELLHTTYEFTSVALSLTVQAT
jgi:hypothetical protein